MKYINIKFKEITDQSGKLIPTELDERLAKLIEPLAMKYPSWQFVEAYASETWSTTTVANTPRVIERRVVTELRVEHKQEKIGIIGQQSYGSYKYVLSNKRITDSLSRGRDIKTGDIKKAIKAVGKFFSPMTTKEKLKDVSLKVSAELQQFAQEKSYKLTNAWRGMQAEAQNFVVTNLLAYETFVNCNPNPKSKINPLDITEFPKTILEASDATALKDAYSKGTAFCVHIYDDVYSIFRTDTNSHSSDDLVIQMLSRTDLLPYVIQRIGMLKLLDNRQSIINVGMKVNENTFVIMEQA